MDEIAAVPFLPYGDIEAVEMCMLLTRDHWHQFSFINSFLLLLCGIPTNHTSPLWTYFFIPLNLDTN